jgi:Zn finger protein HypA/HybF involved in hydrogenase expression
MKIKEITYQSRRDFKAIFECEACREQETKWGYDDRHFHDNVIPNFKCPKCGQSRKDIGVASEYTETRYPEGLQL